MFLVTLLGLGVIGSPYEVYEPHNKFAKAFYTAVLRGGALAGVAVAVDAGIFAL